jgi:hypothetical protein
VVIGPDGNPVKEPHLSYPEKNYLLLEYNAVMDSKFLGCVKEGYASLVGGAMRACISVTFALRHWHVVYPFCTIYLYFIDIDINNYADTAVRGRCTPPETTEIICLADTVIGTHGVLYTCICICICMYMRILNFAASVPDRSSTASWSCSSRLCPARASSVWSTTTPRSASWSTDPSRYVTVTVNVDRACIYILPF